MLPARPRERLPPRVVVLRPPELVPRPVLPRLLIELARARPELLLLLRLVVVRLVVLRLPLERLPRLLVRLLEPRVFEPVLRVAATLRLRELPVRLRVWAAL